MYGDFRILETKGKVAQILGDKPINKLDKASWRPPIIPPLMDADYVGKPIAKSNNKRCGKTRKSIAFNRFTRTFR